MLVLHHSKINEVLDYQQVILLLPYNSKKKSTYELSKQLRGLWHKFRRKKYYIKNDWLTKTVPIDKDTTKLSQTKISQNFKLVNNISRFPKIKNKLKKWIHNFKRLPG